MNPFSSPKHPRPALGPTNSSHSTDNVDYFLRDKVAGAWSWPLSVLYCQGEELWQPYLCSPAPLRPKCRHGVSLSLTLCWRDLNRILLPKVGRVSSVGIATRYGLDGPWIESRWGARFSPPVQTGPGAHPTFCTMGTGSFPAVQRPERGVDHQPHLRSSEVKERVELNLYFPSGPSWRVLGWSLCSCDIQGYTNPGPQFAVANNFVRWRLILWVPSTGRARLSSARRVDFWDVYIWLYY